MKKHDAVRLKDRRYGPIDGVVQSVHPDDYLMVDFGEGFLRFLPAEELEKVPKVNKKLRLMAA